MDHERPKKLLEMAIPAIYVILADLVIAAFALYLIIGARYRIELLLCFVPFVPVLACLTPLTLGDLITYLQETNAKEKGNQENA